MGEQFSVPSHMAVKCRVTMKMKYGTPKAELFAVVTFVEKYSV